MFYGKLMITLKLTHAACLRWAGIAQLVWQLATGWMVQGSNSGGRGRGGGEIFRTLPDRPWGTPSLPHNGYPVIFLGVKRLGRDVHHLPSI
jgi:hypothetical protein